uniref:Uncharacterized protein n=3 Tax=Avena sativa TaxID=4498 RepID=A0ACD5V8V9_AVESA
MSSHRSPLDDGDLLAEIFLRLPPQPSSLPRASAVCKRWRLLVSDPRFLRRFRLHHRRNPPLLGRFVEKFSTLTFLPTMEAPNRVSPGRLSLQFDHGHFFEPLGCRHGLALISDQTRQQFLVWEPVTGDRHQLAVPPGFDPRTIPMVNGAVLRVAGDDHFQVVIVVISNYNTQHGQRVLACVYSSETGLWGDLISTPIPLEPNSVVSAIRDPAVLVGDSLYWQLIGFSTSILEFDFEKQSLAVIQVPVDESEYENNFKVIRADGGGLGFMFVSNFTAQLWERNIDCDGVASWVLGRTIELDKLLSLDSEVEDDILILGFAEENNMVFLWTESGSFMVQLQSLQFKKLSGFNTTKHYFTYESVYTAADIGGEHDGAELLHNA